MTSTKKTSPVDREARAAKQRERAAELQATITAKMETLTQTDQWTAFLDYATKFHAYSTGRVAVFDPANSGTQEWRSAA